MSRPAPVSVRSDALSLRVRDLGMREYQPVWQEMRTFTEARDSETPDEIWFVQHPPVFTLGQAGKPEHILAPGDIPVVRSDRGGQVTYHGPGQLIAYVLVNLKRRRLGVRQFVSALEQSVIDLLAEAGVPAERRCGAPGVYVGGAKIAALGLRVRSGAAYHGMSLNVAMDLEPFTRINPCGYENLAVTQLADVAPGRTLGEARVEWQAHLERLLGALPAAGPTEP